MEGKKQRNALISVFHKEGITEFANDLIRHGFNIYASGGTAKYLKAAGIPVTDVAELVGGEAILEHRVVTLSREIHAGLLARYLERDRTELETLGIPFIDLVAVDLYPIEEKIADPKSSVGDVIDSTDVGGPTMLHSATKGRRIVVADPLDRQRVIKWFDMGEPRNNTFREFLAAKAERVAADHVAASASYIASKALSEAMDTLLVAS